MGRSFRRNGRKQYGTSKSRERYAHARRESSNATIAATNAVLGRELGIKAKAVAKWRKLSNVEDLKTGPISPTSVPSPTRHLSRARRRGRQAETAALQAISYQILSH
jgi:hypothetical protein